MRTSELHEALTFAFKNRNPVMIKGAPGTAKTSVIKQVAKSLGYKCQIHHPVVADPVDFRGLPYVNEKGAKFQPTSDLQELIWADEPLICFFDDIGQAMPAVQAALMQLILERRINGHQVSDNVIFVAATNRREDKAGVSGMITPLVTRWIVLEAEMHIDDWTTWSANNDMPSMLMAFLNFRPDLLHNIDATQVAQINNAPTPRTWEFVGNMLNNEVPTNIRHEMIAGAVGSGAATEFEAFLRTYESLPDIKEMLKKPDYKKIEEMKNGDPSVMYAFVCAIANHITDENKSNFWSILDNIQAEYGVLAVRIAKSKSSFITSSREFMEFLDKHYMEFQGEG